MNKNTVNGTEPLLRLIGDLPAGTPVAFEAAFGWSWLADLLEGYGFEAHLVHPLRCKAIASARLKNDKVDADRGDRLAPRLVHQVRLKPGNPATPWASQVRPVRPRTPPVQPAGCPDQPRALVPFACSCSAAPAILGDRLPASERT